MNYADLLNETNINEPHLLIDIRYPQQASSGELDYICSEGIRIFNEMASALQIHLAGFSPTERNFEQIEAAIKHKAIIVLIDHSANIRRPNVLRRASFFQGSRKVKILDLRVVN